jgi:hypothetical protein
MSAVREPTVAGLFYPELRIVLEREVDEFLLRARSTRVSGAIRGMIVPHAGYAYSGLIAAAGYRLLRETHFDAVMVVGPSHREYFDGISIYPGTAYRTPIGDCPIDDTLRSALAAAHEAITISESGHRHEHSVEVHVPFLQRVLGKVPFVPVVMGDQRRELVLALAAALERACNGRNVLLVASSDLSHYHPYQEAMELDKKVIETVEAYRADDLINMLEEEEVEACGGGPMSAVMLAAGRMGANRARVIAHCNSGDVSGDKETVVGYLTAILTQES